MQQSWCLRQRDKPWGWSGGVGAPQNQTTNQTGEGELAWGLQQHCPAGRARR